MPEDDYLGGGTTNATEVPPESAEGPETSSDESSENESDGEGTLYISESSLGDHQCKVGDVLKFKVVSKDNGELGLSVEDYGDKGGDLRNALAKRGMEY